MGRAELRKLSRDDLIALAVAEGIERSGTLSHNELVEVLSRSGFSRQRDERSGGLLGVARRLVKRIVERGLHLPQARELLGWRGRLSSAPPPAPLATVTLAEIYAAQGHVDKAVSVLDEVLAHDPQDGVAGDLRGRLVRDEAGAQEKSDLLGGSASGLASERTAAAASDAPASGSGPHGAPPGVTHDAERVEVAASGDASAAGPVPPVPDHYGVDEVVALATDPRTVYVYWELRPVRFARVQWRHPDGNLVLRVLTVAPSGADTEQRLRDIDVAALVGDRFIRGLLPGSELRLCLGWLSGDGFSPLAVAAEMQMPRDQANRPPATDWINTAELRRVLSAEGDRAVATSSSTASSRLHSYLDQVTAGRLPSGRLPSGRLPSGRVPPVVDLALLASAAGTVAQGQPLGSRALAMGGASDLFPAAAVSGGAFGGASDLHGGASDLYAESPAVVDTASPAAEAAVGAYGQSDG